MLKYLTDYIKKNDIDGLEDALDNGSDVNQQDDDERTVLMQSCRNGDLGFFKMIMKHKPDIHLEDELGYTALHWAVYSGNSTIVRELIKKVLM